MRYILEGSARKSGNRVRVTAQVIDTVTEENIWVDTYDRNLDDFFAVQDEITKSISVALRVHLWEGGRARFNARGTTSVNAWEYCTQAADLTDSYIRENVAEARRLAKLSLEIDPEYCFAWVILGWTYWQEAYCTWTDSIEGALREAENASFRALQIDPDDADALILSGTIHSLRSRPELAVEACAKAVSIAPGNAEANVLLAYALAYAGEYEKALPYYQTSLRLSPIAPNWYTMAGANIYNFMGETKKAIALYQEAIDIEPESPLARIYFIDALMQDGQIEKAKTVADEVRSLDPSIGVAGFIKSCDSLPKIRDRLRSNLFEMGFRE